MACFLASMACILVLLLAQGCCASVVFPPCATIENLRGSSLPADPALFYTSSSNISYMNAATLGPMARPVLECAVKSWEVLETDPHNNYPWGNNNESVLDAVRQQASDMLGCHVNELALTQSTTVSLNLIGEGLIATGYLQPTDRVLTTDQEHNGGVAVWEHWVDMKRLSGVDRVALPVGGDLTTDSILSAFQQHLQEAQIHGKSYRIVAISHVLTTTGARLPLPQLARMAHDVGALLVVDGAQGPGNVNVNLHESGVDAYTISAHKWLLAPTGSGLLYIKRGRPQEVIRPAQLARGFSAYSQSSGTVPLQTIAGFKYALDLINAFGGLASVESHGLRMANHTREAVLNLFHDEVSILSPNPNSGAESCIVIIALPTRTTKNMVADRLTSEFGVIVKELPDNEGGSPLIKNCIRVSHHIYTSHFDIERLISGLTSILTDSVWADG